jgi:hypothetical protein
MSINMLVRNKRIDIDKLFSHLNLLFHYLPFPHHYHPHNESRSRSKYVETFTMPPSLLDIQIIVLREEHYRISLVSITLSRLVYRTLFVMPTLIPYSPARATDHTGRDLLREKCLAMCGNSHRFFFCQR